MQIDNFHLMTILEENNPLRGLLIEWEQSPTILDNPDYLYDQVALRIQIIAQLLPNIPMPEPSCEEFAIENIEQALELLNRLMELLQGDIMLLDQEFDVTQFHVQLNALNQRNQKLEALRRVSYSLQEVNENILVLTGEIRNTLKQISSTQWDQDYLWLLETRQESLLDRFEQVQRQMELFTSMYTLENMVNRLNTALSMLEGLDETLEALDAVQASLKYVS